jgi:hypothetical protein
MSFLYQLCWVALRFTQPTRELSRAEKIKTLKLDPARMQLISGFIDTYLNLLYNTNTKNQP